MPGLLQKQCSSLGSRRFEREDNCSKYGYQNDPDEPDEPDEPDDLDDSINPCDPDDPDESYLVLKLSKK